MTSSQFYAGGVQALPALSLFTPGAFLFLLWKVQDSWTAELLLLIARVEGYAPENADIR